ncbi:MAG: class II aldolase/adducin family protein [Bacteroidales bacterium]|jgi:L-fuculose-phosphate aldolase|nr:class II aldolase/adducin family protein [Bacteroidales bacterium]
MKKIEKKIMEKWYLEILPEFSVLYDYKNKVTFTDFASAIEKKYGGDKTKHIIFLKNMDSKNLLKPVLDLMKNGYKKVEKKQDEGKEREFVAETMRRIYKQGLTTISGGNISFRNSDGFIFLTASQTDKSCIKAEQIIIFDQNYKNLTPDLKPSMESSMHLKIYKNRADISAIIHSHPIYTSTFSILKQKINTAITGEAAYILGEIAEINYALMGTEELADLCCKELQTKNIGIMRNHGAITLGKTLTEAFDRMEVLEFTAKINFNLLLANSEYSQLNDNQIKEILKLKNGII